MCLLIGLGLCTQYSTCLRTDFFLPSLSCFVCAQSLLFVSKHDRRDCRFQASKFLFLFIGSIEMQWKDIWNNRQSHIVGNVNLKRVSNNMPLENVQSTVGHWLVRSTCAEIFIMRAYSRNAQSFDMQVSNCVRCMDDIVRNHDCSTNVEMADAPSKTKRKIKTKI